MKKLALLLSVFVISACATNTYYNDPGPVPTFDAAEKLQEMQDNVLAPYRPSAF